MATKTLGIVRKLDDLGRITLPMELRRTLHIEENAPMEIYVEGNVVCLKSVTEDGCAICHAEHQLVEVDGVKACRTCINRLAEKLMQKG